MNIENKMQWLGQFYGTDDLSKLSEEQVCRLYEATQPKKVKIADLDGVDVSTYRINSGDGYVKALEWRNKGTKRCVYLTTASGKKVTSSIDHIFEMATGLWKYAVMITAGEEIVTKDGVEKIAEVTYAGEHVVYDFHIDHENHRYYTNDISSHNSGSGKSLFMQNISVNWLLQGLNGVYITLELSEELCSMRIDSMIAGCSTKEIFKDLETIEMKVKMTAKKAGHFRVKYMPAQSNVNDIRAYLKELQVQTGIKLDFIMIDYLDLLMPVSAKVSPSDLFVKDKYVSEEIRNLAKEFGILLVTASQLNRAAVEEIEFDHSHISGGISKINTADNVFGIFTSRAMRERGKYQIQCMKTRSSSGVGQKVDLDFDIESLRISGSDEEPGTNTSKANSILSQIKHKEHADVSQGELHKPVKAEVNSAKLKNMLAGLRSGN